MQGGSRESEYGSSENFLAVALTGAVIALAIAALIPATADAQFATFSNGVLTVHSSEGKVVPRCESDGTITVSGAIPDGGGTCSELREIDADSIVNALFDFSQLPADAGGGPCSIVINAKSLITDPIDISDDKFIGDPNAINKFDGGLGFDSLTGGNCDDVLNGGPDSDKIDGGGGNDKLVGGPGKDQEQQ
jgi:Ca2+-binding RTX toxin-like protein